MDGLIKTGGLTSWAETLMQRNKVETIRKNLALHLPARRKIFNNNPVAVWCFDFIFLVLKVYRKIREFFQRMTAIGCGWRVSAIVDKRYSPVKVSCNNNRVNLFHTVNGFVNRFTKQLLRKPTT
jgi:hypothetical protein